MPLKLGLSPRKTKPTRWQRSLPTGAIRGGGLAAVKAAPHRDLSGPPVISGSLGQEAIEGLRRFRRSAEDPAGVAAVAAKKNPEDRSLLTGAISGDLPKSRQSSTGTVTGGPPVTSGSLDQEDYEGLRRLRGIARNL